MRYFLRNVVAREQGNSTGMSRPVHLKRQLPLGVSASAVVLGSAMAVLGTPIASGAAAKPFRQAASADTKGVAVGRAMPRAQPLVLNNANAPHAADPSQIVRTLALTDGTAWPPFAGGDLHNKPSFMLTPGESVLVSMCRANLGMCDSPMSGMRLTRPDGADRHEWAGRITVQAPKPGAQGAADLSGDISATAGPLVMPHGDTVAYAGPIKGSLRDAWRADGLPVNLTVQLSRIFAGRLDVSSRAQSGDSYRIVYDLTSRDRAGLQNGRIRAVEVTLAGRKYSAVWFVAPGRKDGDYFSFDGKRLVAQAFAMPVTYGRVSSPFGYRIHPVSGVHLFHTGVDLTARVGTPVVAACAGTVQFIGSDGSGYGKHVVLRHARGYTTYYAHLSAFASGLRVGAKVSQGQLLGAVGQTGVATGPHLHFEVRLNNAPTDPLKLTSRFGAAPLAGRERVAFDRVASVAREQFALSAGATRTASIAPAPRG